MIDLRDLDYFLSLEFISTMKGFVIHTDISKRFNMLKCNSPNTLMEEKSKFRKNEDDKISIIFYTNKVWDA